MRSKEFQGYGDIKQWYWGARSDVCVGTNQVITPGTIYITPWTMDTMCGFIPQGLRWKWSYAIAGGAPLAPWQIDFHIAVYKMLRGTGGTSQTLSRISSPSIWTWTGLGAVATTTLYDGSSGATATVLNVSPITDGALYIAMLWIATLSIGQTATITSYGTTLPTGTWLNLTSGVTGTSSLVQTINALGGSAKVFQEHWIGEY